MIDIMYYIGVVTGALFIGGLVLYMVMEAIEYLVRSIEQTRYENIRRVFLSDLLELGRWCGHEFPQLEFVSQHLIADWKSGVRFDPDRFRKLMRDNFKQPTKQEQK